MDVILGCGSVGRNTARLLEERGRDVRILDKDPDRVEELRDSGMTAHTGDLRDLAPHRDDLEGADSLLLLCSDMEANLEAIEYIRSELPEAFIIARAIDPVSSDALKKAGADEVVQPSDVIAQSVVREIDEWADRRAGEQLRDIVESADSVAIFLHDNPDPDALGAGFALQTICEAYGTEAPIYYGGNIGHQENRAFVNLLEIELNRVDPESEILDIVNSHDKVALIDCAIAGRNNVLPREVVPNIVFDHHQVEDGEVIADFAEVRPSVGASSTILTRYLQQLDVDVDQPLAVALLYGIRTDTAGFTAGATAEDMQAATFLSSFADMDLLKQIESPPMAGDTVDVLGEAIVNREVYGSNLVTHVGFINDRDILPQAADFLLQLEGVSTVLVYGIVDDVIHLSGRSKDVRVNLGEVLERAFGPGNAGGHARSAGGQIKLGIFGDVAEREALVRLARDAVQKQFLKELGVDSEEE